MRVAAGRALAALARGGKSSRGRYNCQFTLTVDPPATPSYQTLTGLGVGVTVIAALYFGKDILLPITVAALLSFVLSPLVGILRRLRIPRVVAVVFSVGLALAIIGGVGALLGSQIVEVAGDLPLYQTTIEKKVDVLRKATLGRIAEVASRFRGTLGQAGQISPPPASPAGEQTVSHGFEVNKTQEPGKGPELLVLCRRCSKHRSGPSA